MKERAAAKEGEAADAPQNNEATAALKQMERKEDLETLIEQRKKIDKREKQLRNESRQKIQSIRENKRMKRHMKTQSILDRFKSIELITGVKTGENEEGDIAYENRGREH